VPEQWRPEQPAKIPLSRKANLVIQSFKAGRDNAHLVFKDLRICLTRRFRKNMMLTLVIVASLAIGNRCKFGDFQCCGRRCCCVRWPYPQAGPAGCPCGCTLPQSAFCATGHLQASTLISRNENHSFEQMALAQSRTFSFLTGREQPERIDGVRTQFQPCLELLRRKTSTRAFVVAGRGQAR